MKKAIIFFVAQATLSCFAIHLVLLFLIPTNQIQATEADFIVSEIMYDLDGADSGYEWIEIYNSGEEEIALGNTWRFFDGSNHNINFYQGSSTVVSRDFFILVDNGDNFLMNHPGFEGNIFDTVMSLPNSSSSIALSFDSGETYSLQESYDSTWGASGNGHSLEKINLDNNSSSLNWQESFVLGGTPGKDNSSVSDILAPVAMLACPDILEINELGLFDASSSSDPQDLELSYFWEFGDGQEASSSLEYYFYEQVGSQQINLIVSNGELEDSVSCVVEIVEIPEVAHGIDWAYLIINEFLPNPIGSDSAEWIELYNNSPETLGLSGFKIKDNASRIFTLDEDSGIDLQLLAYDYLLLPKSVTGISLNNSGGDAVIIMSPEGNIIQTVNYVEAALEGRSYAMSDNAFVWTKTPTPGMKNQISINQSPIAQISLEENNFFVGTKLSFSAESSYDPEGDDLDYFWEFGDGKTSAKEKIKHSFDNLGSYTVRLTVIDPEGATDIVEFPVEIYQEEKSDELISLDEEIELNEIEKIIVDLAEDDLIISEFIPNPVGSDDNEWIELYNASDEVINLHAWQVDDKEGGSKPYVIDGDMRIEAKSFFILKREDSKITLNNTSDSVRLFTPSGELWQEIVYEKIPEGKSYAWDLENQEWFEASPSLGSVNIFYENIEAEYIYSVWETRELDRGDEVLVQGVILRDRIENSASLYLMDWDGNYLDYDNLIEVYMHSKDFPELEKGQIVTVSGEISRAGTLPRIKIKNSEQIWSNDLKVEIIEPSISDLEDVLEDNFDSWQKIKGVIVKKSGKNIYLATNIDEDYLLRVYNKYPDKDMQIEKGQEIIASGILTETDNVAKLTVFQSEDILLSQKVLGEKIENVESKNNQSSTDYKIETEESNQNLSLFVLVGLSGVILLYFVNKKYLHKL